MQIAILSLQDEKIMAADRAGKVDIAKQWQHSREQSCEQRQTLALMCALRDAGQLAPTLFCIRGSALHRRAEELNLPLLALGSPGAANIGNMFRLWRWQRRMPAIMIQTIGRQAVPLGLRLHSMRKPGSSILSQAFFLAGPNLEDARMRQSVLLADHVLCGSSQLRDKLLGLAPCQKTGAEKANAGRPDDQDDVAPAGQEYAHRLCILPPGADFSGISANHKPLAWQEGGRFVFGMDASLVPRSGALLVVRAMAAIWQFEDLPPWEVRMFGQGPRFQEILEEAGQLGVHSRLCLLADQPPKEMTRHCHAWLAPGSSSRELPETLWLGPAVGLPLVCSDTSLHRERLACQMPANCQFFAANDPQELARAMRGTMQQIMAGKVQDVPDNDLLHKAGLPGMAGHALDFYRQWLGQ